MLWSLDPADQGCRGTWNKEWSFDRIQQDTFMPRTEETHTHPACCNLTTDISVTREAYHRHGGWAVVESSHARQRASLQELQRSPAPCADVAHAVLHDHQG